MDFKEIKKRGFVFDDCQKKVSYSIYHQEKPLPLSDEMMTIIEYLLWYVPNISSIQSPKNELIDSIAFEDFTFGIVKQVMNLTDKDVIFLKDIPRKVVEYYENEICPHEEKLILTTGHHESKTNALLRHIRNSIAHGYFNIVEDLFVGFDFQNNDCKKDECTAFIKIKPRTLLDALLRLDSEVTAEQLALIALQRTGYEAEKFHRKKGDPKFDFYVKKGKKRYALEVKKYHNIDVLDEKEVENLIDSFSTCDQRIIPILFINTSLLTEQSKQRLRREQVVILDIKNIQQMLQRRDILSEIT
ncbi:MAG: restriction endonuclease, partial [Tissierellia bacterium]|nr:restriction endonuclease [Tissierellia bacterium]